jgi:GNAT superfamily N-acetyltransferase
MHDLLTIRRAGDLASLTRRFGQRRFFADRLSRQDAGRGVLLTAWHENVMVGDVYLWLEPAEEPEIEQNLKGVPLVTHLEVHPDHRRKGFGTLILGAAEWLLASWGYSEVALAVEVTNTEAERLYVRLRYENWSHPRVICYSPADRDGHRLPEICNVMVKHLSGLVPALDHQVEIEHDLVEVPPAGALLPVRLKTVEMSLPDVSIAAPKVNVGLAPVGPDVLGAV